MMSRRVVIGVLCGVAACTGDTTAPGHSTGITFLSGNLQSDTIGALLPKALVIRVAVTPVTANGQPQVIELESPDYDLALLGSSQPYYTPLLDDTTTSGQISVQVLLGGRVGKAKLIVRARTAGFVDTATFTIKHGAVTSVVMSPTDTLVPVQGKITLSSQLFDRDANLVTDTAVTYRVTLGPATLSGSTATMTAAGVAEVQAQLGTVNATAVIFGTPSGTIAASLDDGTGIVTFHLDGSGMTKIPAPHPGTVRWAPNGQSLVFDQTTNGGATEGPPLLQSVDLSGHVTVLDNSTGTATSDMWPSYSRDGQWIYYAKDWYAPLWRVHPDGTSDSSITMTTRVLFPSVSPDGQHIAYVDPNSGYRDVLVLDLANGTITDLGQGSGVAPQWSPLGDLIAVCTYDYNIYVMKSDGSSPFYIDGAWAFQYDWSPDEQWLIARSSDKYLYLINVGTQLSIRLPFTGAFGSPTWH
ncbi:MAG TPA: hypothetical protein VNV25_22095 [Gemmatimonadaceae bacterium]|nr:hypothetical protein [Gemmatimonadaceae bacterium]